MRKIGDYSVFARKDRNSSDWYVGCITDENARELDIPLSFFRDGGKVYLLKYMLTVMMQNGKQIRLLLNMKKKTVTASDTLHVKLATSGGCAIRFIKQ